MGKNRNTFLKAFLTLHYRGFESRLGEKTENFFENFSVHTHHWRSIACLAENSGDFLFSTPLWRWEKRFEEGFRNYVLTLPNGHEKCVWAKKSETFSSFFCSHFPLESRFPCGPLFGQFFFSTYMGEMSTPTTHWRKSGCLNEKRMLLSKSFSH